MIIYAVSRNNNKNKRPPTLSRIIIAVLHARPFKPTVKLSRELELLIFREKALAKKPEIMKERNLSNESDNRHVASPRGPNE
jgi:hypothetical protein